MIMPPRAGYIFLLYIYSFIILKKNAQQSTQGCFLFCFFYKSKTDDRQYVGVILISLDL